MSKFGSKKQNRRDGGFKELEKIRETLDFYRMKKEAKNKLKPKKNEISLVNRQYSLFRGKESKSRKKKRSSFFVKKN